MAEDWRIHRDREGCQKPGCPLPTSKAYFAVLEWGRPGDNAEASPPAVAADVPASAGAAAGVVNGDPVTDSPASEGEAAQDAAGAAASPVEPATEQAGSGSQEVVAVEAAVARPAEVPRGGGDDGEAIVCVRREMCDACFQDYERRCGVDNPPIFWRAHRKATGSKEPVLDMVSLRALFDRLGSVDDARARALRYFAALLLLRKRALKMVKPRTREQEQADLVVTDPKLKEMEPVALFAPAIEATDLDTVKEQLLEAIGEVAEAPADEAST